MVDIRKLYFLSFCSYSSPSAHGLSLFLNLCDLIGSILNFFHYIAKSTKLINDVHAAEVSILMALITSTSNLVEDCTTNSLSLLHEEEF